MDGDVLSGDEVLEVEDIIDNDEPQVKIVNSIDRNPKHVTNIYTNNNINNFIINNAAPFPANPLLGQQTTVT